MSRNRKPPRRRQVAAYLETQIDSRIKPPDHVYHYTDRAGIDGIRRDGLIRRHRTRLYGDWLCTRVLRDTRPIVWLSINPIVEQTTMVKVLRTLFPDPDKLAGSLFRVVLPYGYEGDIGLGEYTEAEGIPHAEWEWNIRTGHSVGSDYTTWRIVSARDIPRADWLGIEVIGVDSGGICWSPHSSFLGGLIP